LSDKPVITNNTEAGILLNPGDLQIIKEIKINGELNNIALIDVQFAQTNSKIELPYVFTSGILGSAITDPSSIFNYAGKGYVVSNELSQNGEAQIIAGYNVIFDANDGTGKKEYQQISASTESPQLADIKFERSGYTFIGWNTKADGSGDSYAPKATIAKRTEDLLLYAQWARPMTVSAPDVTAAFDGKAHGITVTVTKPSSGYTVKYGTTEGSYTLDASPAITNAGTQTVYYQVTAANYDTYTGKATVTVNPVDMTVSAPDVTAAYDGTAHGITVSVTKPSSGYTVKYGTTEGSYTLKESPKITNVGTQTVYYQVTAANYNTYTGKATVTVNPVDMTVSAPDITAAYDGTAHGITVSVTKPSSGYTVKYGTTEGSYTLNASPTITNVGTQTVYYQVTAANYNSYKGKAEVTITKANAALSTAPAALNPTYSGSAQSLVSAGTSNFGNVMYALGTDATTKPAESAYTAAIPQGTNAGTYYVWYMVPGTDNYNGIAPAVLEAKITPKSIAGATVTLNPTSLTYNGSEQSVNVQSVKLPDGTTLGSGDYSVTGTAATNAGSYTATVTGKGNYTGTTAAFWQILPKSITGATVTLDPTSLVYNGSQQSVSVKSVVLADKTALGESDYSVAGNVGLNATTYTVTITGSGNYTDTATAAWEITKATAVMSKAPAALNTTYSGSAKNLVSKGEATFGEVVYAIGKDATTKPADTDFSTTIPTGTEAGTYYVWYMVPGTNNYNGIDAAVLEVTIQKIVYKLTSGAGQSYTQGTDTTLTFTIERNINDNEAKEHLSRLSYNNSYIYDKSKGGDTKYCKVKSGSIIVELQSEFLKTLKTGEKKITATFDDGADPLEVSFEVVTATTHKVTFNMNGHGTAPTAQTIADGQKATKPTNPTATGYTFGGWYTDQACTTAFDFSTAITKDITLYAKWTQSSNNTTTKNNSNGSGGSGGSSGNRTTPSTGDTNNTVLWIILSAVSVLVICGVILIILKKRRVK